MLPRIWRATSESFWSCPKCDQPAYFWFSWYMIAPRWRCNLCRISGRLDSHGTESRSESS